ncbi:hypothetical protein GBF38_015667 [Nibea albiflora]|uniref:Uncharacterized protein n=1 Tax=Nibea albiflora TaxID=240163 RepID=A0ACB7ELA6_NIBAL|nr:hypothetical protein GBF38_015667 [Nibea albiflora]
MAASRRREKECGKMKENDEEREGGRKRDEDMNVEERGKKERKHPRELIRSSRSVDLISNLPSASIPFPELPNPQTPTEPPNRHVRSQENHRPNLLEPGRLPGDLDLSAASRSFQVSGQLVRIWPLSIFAHARFDCVDSEDKMFSSRSVMADRSCTSVLAPCNFVLQVRSPMRPMQSFAGSQGSVSVCTTRLLDHWEEEEEDFRGALTGSGASVVPESELGSTRQSMTEVQRPMMEEAKKDERVTERLTVSGW